MRVRQKLYVTDSSATRSFPTLQGGAVDTESPVIFVYDLDENALPVNKCMADISRSRVPDGIHVDGEDRIWTGEFEVNGCQECKGQGPLDYSTLRLL
jgi:sugar lactone lactonase YvrE